VIPDCFLPFVQRYEALRAAAPEMTGISFAFERGWISPQEVQDAERAWEQNRAEQEQVFAELAPLLLTHRAAWQDWLDAATSLAQRVAAGLEPQASDFQVALLKDALPRLSSLSAEQNELDAQGMWALWAVWGVRKSLDEAS
jgi:hypothetical protein